MSRRKLANRLAELLKKYDAEIEAAFLAAVRNRAASINLSQLADAIEARDIERALRIAGLTQSDLYPFNASINAAYVAGGQTIQEAAPKFAVRFGFDGRATRAEQWARRHVGDLVTHITQEQTEMLREVIAEQISGGINPRRTALDIAGRIGPGKVRGGGIVGLNRQQAMWLENARRELAELDGHYFTRKARDRRSDPLVRRAIREGKPLSQADIDRIAGRYSDGLLIERGRTIARTESITALRAGRREGMQQAIESGAVRADRVKRTWDSTMDGRTRPDHRAMDGREVYGMDEPYTLPDGSRMMFPGDTSLGAPASQTALCRCYEAIEVDWLKA